MKTWMIETKLGRIEVGVGDDGGIARLAFAGQQAAMKINQPESEPPRVVGEVASQLDEYGEGKRERLEVPITRDGVQGTAFEQRVWEATAAIPRGETRTYAEVAAAIGNVKASRAVGAALGRNPLLVIVPCHRVVGRDGSLTGYAGGVEVKRRLLEVEGVIAAPR